MKIITDVGFKTLRDAPPLIVGQCYHVRFQNKDELQTFFMIASRPTTIMSGLSQSDHQVIGIRLDDGSPVIVVPTHSEQFAVKQMARGRVVVKRPKPGES